MFSVKIALTFALMFAALALLCSPWSWLPCGAWTIATGAAWVTRGSEDSEDSED